MKSEELWKDSGSAAAIIAELVRRTSTKKPIEGFSGEAWNDHAFEALLHATTDGRLSPSLVDSAIRNILTFPARDLNAFTKEYQTLYSSSYGSMKGYVDDDDDTSTAYIPLLANLDGQEQYQIRLLGRIVRLVPRDVAEEELGCSVLSRLQRTDWFQGNESMVEMCNAFAVIQGPGFVFDVWDSVDIVFSLFRGIAEYSLTGPPGWRSDRSPDIAQPLSHLQFPGWALIQSPDCSVSTALLDPLEQRNAQDATLSKSELQLIQENAALFTEDIAESSTLRVLATAFRLYGQSMDGRHASARLLSLWQLLEALALTSDAGGKTDEVVNRIMPLTKKLNIPGMGCKPFLQRVAKVRNDVVHRGLTAHVQQLDVDMLRDICIAAIDWLKSNHPSLPTQAHLRHYFQFNSYESVRRKQMSDVLTFIAESIR